MSRSGLAVHLQTFAYFPLRRSMKSRIDVSTCSMESRTPRRSRRRPNVPKKPLYSIHSRARSRREVEDPAEDAQGSEQDCRSLPLTTARSCIQSNFANSIRRNYWTKMGAGDANQSRPRRPEASRWSWLLHLGSNMIDTSGKSFIII